MQVVRVSLNWLYLSVRASITSITLLGLGQFLNWKNSK